MIAKKYKLRVVVTACSLALVSTSGLSVAQTVTNERTASPPIETRALGEDAEDAVEQVTEAAEVLREMEREPELMQVLQQAQGIFIMPDYGRAALGVGARGGEGVLLVQQNGKWSDPAFYDYGGVSVGLQAGIEAGSIAMILNSQKAVDSFMQNNNWSLNAEAGLTVIAWSGKAQGSVGKGDVTVWSNAKGLFGDVAVSVTGINFDEEETAAFYGKEVAQRDIFAGNVQAPSHVAALKQALPAGAGAISSGASMGTQESSGASATTAPADTRGLAGPENPPFTEDVEYPGQGTTGTGIGGPTEPSR
jgi:lipid-binding SYLF domain-containing protein